MQYEPRNQRHLPHIVCVGGEDHHLRIPYLLGLQNEGFRVTALSTGDGEAIAKSGIAHQSYEFNRFSNGFGDLRAVKAFRKRVLQLTPDIVHSFDTKPNLFVPLAVRNTCAVVRTINGLGWVFSSTQPKALLLRPVYGALQRIVSSWTAATAFQNSDDHALFKKYRLLGPTPSVLIPSSGIDSAAFEKAMYSGPSPEKLRAELGLTGKKVIIYVGRITREKGIPALLEALPAILLKKPSARILLVGPLESEGPFAVDRKSIEKLAPNVIALGRRQDVPSLLQMADVFAFPTEYREGVPRVLMEAGLARLPVVATRMPGCNDVIEDGYNGYLVPPRNPGALAQGILKLLSDPVRAREMGDMSVQRVKDKFELGKVIGAYSNLYNSVLNRRYKLNAVSNVSELREVAK